MLGSRSRLRPLPLSLVEWCASCVIITIITITIVIVIITITITIIIVLSP